MLRLTAPLLVFTLLILAGCGGGSGDTDNELALRFVHAAPDAPRVNFLVDGQVLFGARDYTESGPRHFVTPRNYDLAVQAFLPDRLEPIVDLPDQPLLAGHDYSLVVAGSTLAGSIQPLFIDNPITPVSAGNARLQLVHAVPGGQPLDIHVTVPDATLDAAMAQLSFGGVGPTQEVAAGEWQVRITPAGTPGTVLFDSGPIPLAAGADALMIIGVNTGSGSSGLMLIVHGGGFDTVVVPDRNLTAEVRTVHASPDTPAIDLTAATGDPAVVTPLADALPYGAVSGNVPLSPATYVLTATPDGDAATTLFTFSQGLPAGQKATVIAAGLRASIGRVLLADDPRPVGTESKLRIAHLSPAAGLVDVYLAAPDADLATIAPGRVSASLGTQTGYLSLLPGDYRLTLTAAGTKTVLASVDLAATAGTVFTALVLDTDRAIASDGLPVTLSLLDDTL